MVALVGGNVVGTGAIEFDHIKSVFVSPNWHRKGIANAPPSADDPVDLLPRLTLRMVARLQNFPDSWEFAGGKTAQYRQIGNALPPAVAFHVGESIAHALNKIPVRQPSPKQLELLTVDVA